MKEPEIYEVKGYERLERTVRPGNNSSARIHLPTRHIGKKVTIIITDRPEEEPDD